MGHRPHCIAQTNMPDNDYCVIWEHMCLLIQLDYFDDHFSLYR